MDKQIEQLREKVTGSVVAPNDSKYEELRVTHFNKTANPAVIVLCATSMDVAAAIKFARDNRLVISVRSGGHNGAGLSTNEGGVVIDVTPMHAVTVVDIHQRLVRVGAGAQWGDVAKTLAPHGLSLTSGDTRSVGVGGLTLGGGLGWMVRKYGVTVDTVVSADIVTVDGRTLHASTNENPDLFWAIRGGGSNFGVVTSFEFIAQPIKDIVGGTITYAFEDRREVLKGLVDYMRTAPRELTTIANMIGAFMPGMPPQLLVTVCFAGDDETQANEAIAPLLELGKVITNDITKKPYGDMLEESMDIGDMQARAHNGFAPKLSHELVDVIVDHFAITPEAPLIQIRALGGAVDDIAEDAMAFCHRGNEGFMIAPVFSPSQTPEAEAIAAADKAWAPLKPFVNGAYCNFFTDTRIPTLMEGFSAKTYDRLSKLKKIYDPKNMLIKNANIEPFKNA